MKTTHLGALIFTLFLGACVTINIYFPAAEAREAAEKIVEDILQKVPAKPKVQPPAADDKGASRERNMPATRLGSVLDFFVPSAHAAKPNFSVDTPEIRRIQASLKRRHGALSPYFRSGAIGLTGDGRVEVRDPKAISLRDRAKVNKLVARENSDRNALYTAIAKANGHPEWKADVQAVFARTWIDKAAKGTWYRKGNGKWARK